MNILRKNSLLFREKTIFLVCTLLIAWLQSSDIQNAQNRSDIYTEESLSQNAELKQQLTVIKNSPSLGFRNLLAGGMFLQFLQYFSDVSDQESIEQHLSPDFFETIIALDPFYRDYYLFLSSSTTMYAGQPQRTVELMAKGLEQIDPAVIPDSPYIWRYKGVDELLFLGDSQSAQRSFEMAAEWASQSDAPDSVLLERASRQTAEFLKSDPDSRYAQLAAWSSVLANAVNEDIRKEATRRIQELGWSVDEEGRVRANSVQTGNSSEEIAGQG